MESDTHAGADPYCWGASESLVASRELTGFRCLGEPTADARSLAYSPVVWSDLPFSSIFRSLQVEKRRRPGPPSLVTTLRVLRAPCAANYFPISINDGAVNIQYQKKARPRQTESGCHS